MMRISQLMLPTLVVAFNRRAEGEETPADDSTAVVAADEHEVIHDEHTHQNEDVDLNYHVKEGVLYQVDREGSTPEPITLFCPHNGGGFDADDTILFRLHRFTKTSLEEVVAECNKKGKEYNADLMWADWLKTQHVEKKFWQRAEYTKEQLCEAITAKNVQLVAVNELQEEDAEDRQTVNQKECDDEWAAAPYYFDEHEYVLLPNVLQDQTEEMIGWLHTRDPTTPDWHLDVANATWEVNVYPVINQKVTWHTPQPSVFIVKNQKEIELKPIPNDSPIYAQLTEDLKPYDKDIEYPPGHVTMGQNATTNSTCFSWDSMVQTPSGDVAVGDLTVGTIVNSAAGAESVVSFLHDSPLPATMVRVKHALGELELSATHQIFLADGSTISAEELSVGDILANGAAVTALDTVSVTGFRAPLTKSGTISVGNTVASSYVAEGGVSHWISHLMTAPARIFGVSTAPTQVPVAAPVFVSA